MQKNKKKSLVLRKLPEGKMHIGRSLSILHRATQHYIDRNLKSYGINKGQMEVLLMLLHEGAMSQVQINRHLMYNKASITKMINSLEDQGYVTRIASSIDKRENIIELTEKCNTIFPIIFNVVCDWEKELVKGFETDEVELARKLLWKMVDGLE